MRYTIRRAVTGGVALAAAALTIGGLASTPAQADPVSPPSLSCAVDTGSQQRTINCTVTASGENLHFVRINNITLGQTFVVSTKLPCSTGGVGGAANLNFRAPEGNKYRVTVVDCAGDKYVYKIDKNGNVITPAPAPSLVITQVSGCEFSVAGSGLEPNSIPTWVINGVPQALGNVAPNGTWVSPANLNPGDSLYITDTTAGGGTITSNTVTCPNL